MLAYTRLTKEYLPLAYSSAPNFNPLNICSVTDLDLKLGGKSVPVHTAMTVMQQ